MRRFYFEVTMDNETMIAFGQSVKALPDGRVVGIGVRFGGQDLTGEYFDKQTYLGEGKEFPAMYNHGQDPEVGRRVIGKSKITKTDQIGVWFETQLNLRDEYEKAIYELARAGKLAYSTGSSSHTVVKDAGYIKQWPLVEVSLTPTPAEPRNGVIPLKSLYGELVQAAAEQDTAQGTDFEQTKPQVEKITETKMEAIEIKSAVDEAVKAALAAQKAEAQAEADRQAAIKQAEEAGYKKAQEEMKSVQRGGYATNVKKVTDVGFKDDEVKSFLHFVRTGDDAAYKAAMQGQTDSEGGYAVPDDFYNQIVPKRNEVSVIRQTGVISIPTSLDRVLVPTEGTAATKFVVTAEEGSYDENEPTLGQTAITVYKLTKLIKISEELEMDAKANFGGWLSTVWGRALGLAENYYFFNVAANGTSQPQSVTYASTLGHTGTGSATAVTAAELLALIYAMPSAYAGNMKLVMRRSTLGAIRALSGNPFSFIPTPSGTGNAMEAGTLHGIPVFLTDELPAMASATKSIVLFNPDCYAIAEREGLTVVRNPYLYNATGQIGLFARARMGGAALQAEGILHLLQKT
jgi:HK97 family phage major capsid protein